MKEKKYSGARPCRSYPHVIYARVTEREKAKIQTLAKSSCVSASRYLVRLATEGKPPPSGEELNELRTLRFLLAKVSTNLNQIAHRTNLAALLDEPPPPVEELLGVVAGVKRLSKEILRRL